MTTSLSSTQHTLFVFLGLPSWALVDVTWSLLSQLASHLPESYAISVFLVLALTIGNTIPLLSNTFLKAASQNQVRAVIYGILSTGFTCGVLISLFWHQTIPIGSHRYSLIFYALFFIAGACSSTSNVTHYMYVAKYSSTETTALSTGMALGSMTAGILGISQGLFLCSVGMSITHVYITVALLYLPAIFSLNLMHAPTDNGLESPDSPLLSDHVGLSHASPTHGDDKLIMDSACTVVRRGIIASVDSQSQRSESIWGHHSTLLYVQAGNSFLGYGVVPSLISPVCSRFSSPYTVLLLATGLLCALDPACRALTALRPLRTQRQVFYASAILASLAMCLIITLAFPSSAPPLSSPYGGALPVLLYVSFGVGFGFTNTSVFILLKSLVPPDEVQDAYRWTGIVSQTGAMMGSFLSFILVISGCI
mmetsp:Transcript_21016/g.30341  ORF Transcript_21016/g.30341 Transcript_21016/m.30341 type:complete len:423 (+) Transcript_21016:99-1367(+)